MTQHSSELVEIIASDLIHGGTYSTDSITQAIQGLERVLVLMRKEEFDLVSKGE